MKFYFKLFILISLIGCKSQQPGDMKDVGRITIINHSGESVKVISLQIGGSSFEEELASGFTRELFFMCEKRNTLPEFCEIRWQLNGSNGKLNEKMIDLRSLNGDYVLTLDSSDDWIASEK